MKIAKETFCSYTSDTQTKVSADQEDAKLKFGSSEEMNGNHNRDSENFQKLKYRRLAFLLARKFRDKEEELKRCVQVHQAQLTSILRALYAFQSKLLREKHALTKQLEKRDSIISFQHKEITKLLHKINEKCSCSEFIQEKVVDDTKQMDNKPDLISSIKIDNIDGLDDVGSTKDENFMEHNTYFINSLDKHVPLSVKDCCDQLEVSNENNCSKLLKTSPEKTITKRSDRLVHSSDLCIPEMAQGHNDSFHDGILLPIRHNESEEKLKCSKKSQKCQEYYIDKKYLSNGYKKLRNKNSDSSNFTPVKNIDLPNNRFNNMETILEQEDSYDNELYVVSNSALDDIMNFDSSFCNNHPGDQQEKKVELQFISEDEVNESHDLPGAADESKIVQTVSALLSHDLDDSNQPKIVEKRDLVRVVDKNVDIRSTFEEYRFEDTIIEESSENGSRSEAEGIECSISKPQETVSGYERFLEVIGLTQKSILSPSRVISNHRSVLKPKDIKYRNRAKSSLFGEKYGDVSGNGTVKYWTEQYI